MLDRVTATRFDRQRASGKTGPCDLECARTDGSAVKLAAKFSAGGYSWAIRRGGDGELPAQKRPSSSVSTATCTRLACLVGLRNESVLDRVAAARIGTRARGLDESPRYRTQRNALITNGSSSEINPPLEYLSFLVPLVD